MVGSRTTAWLMWFVISLTANVAGAQLPQTRLYALFPPGGQIGQTVDVTVTAGADLEELQTLTFNHSGLKAAPKMQDVNGKPQPVANQFVVTIDGSVPPGLYDVRAVGMYGQSNPRTFVVGSQPEIQEKEANNTPLEAQPVEVGQVVNAKATPATDVDWYKFQGKQGQRVLCTVHAQRIDSRMHAALELYDPAGRRLDFSRDEVRHDPLVAFTLPADGEYLVKTYDFVYGGSEEYFYRFGVTAAPHIDYVLPPAGAAGSTGEYTLYGSNLPGSQPAGVQLHGRALEKLTVSIPLPGEPGTLRAVDHLDSFEAGLDGISYTLDSPAGRSNPVFIHFATGAVALEQEPNDKAAQSQKLTLPAEVAGQFQAKNDTDWFTFDAKAKEIYWIEVYGQRNGTTADPFFTLDRVTVNEKGEEQVQRITAQDDNATPPLPYFNVRTDDPAFKFEVPADGTYRIAVRDRYFASRGDADLVYHLSIRKESPDFRVVLVPTTPAAPTNNAPNSQATTWAAGLRKGENYAVHVILLRRDGFDGAVRLHAEGLPPKVTCPDVTIAGTDSAGVLIFSAAEDAPEWAGTVKIVATARIESPTAARLLTEAQAAAKAAADEFAKALPTVQTASAELRKATEALNAAKNELAAKPEDDALKQKVRAAEAKLAETAAALQKATEAVSAVSQRVKATGEALSQAEAARKAAIRDVTYEARGGTVVWGAPQPNVAGHSRLSRGLELSVLKEPAPIQLQTAVYQVEANHNQQVLVPIKLAKRNEFDNNVALNWVGVPKNLQAENKTINKGKADEILRLFVPPNVAPGTYTLYVSGQGQVSYRRYPERAERAKAEFQQAEQAEKDAAEALKQSNQKKEETAKQAAAAAENLKKAVQTKQDAEKKLAEAQAAEKAAAEEVQKAGDNAEAKAAAEKKLQDAQTAVKQATEAVTNAEKARADAETASKTAEEMKTATEAVAKQADEKAKATVAAKQAAQKRMQDAENASKPQNINLFPPSTPIVLTVKEAPFTLTAAPANGGAVKRGEKVEVKVTVNRINGYAGPVTLTLPPPPNVTGLAADPVTIPADKNEGVLVVQANGDATEGQLPYMVVRATAEFRGQAAVDAPITIKVSK